VKSCVLQEYDADFVVDEMPEDPVDGVYLVKGDGELVTVNDGGEETIQLPVGTVVKVGDTYWIVDANSVHVVFPTLTAVEQSPGWYLVSPVEQVDPQAQLNLQAWNNGWYTVYVGAIPAYVNLNALEMYEGMRAKWVRGECSYYTRVDVDPPLPAEPDAACGPLNNELNMELCYAL